MDTTKTVVVVGLAGAAAYFLFIRRNPATGLALVDELLVPRAATDLPTHNPGNTSAYGQAAPGAPRTSAIGVIGASSAAVGGLLASGGSTAAAGAGATAAATGTGIGVASTIAITGGIAGAALLTWAVWKKGLFRGGEEALLVNPDRDQFLAQPPIRNHPPGPGGTAWEQTDAHKLAAQLVEWGQPGGGGPLWDALMKADTIAEFEPAARAIQRIYAAHGLHLQAP
jgi:hypothetical protein